MKASPIFSAVALVGAGILLTGAGGGRVKSGPATVPYVCENGRPANAIYDHGGDFLHAKALVTYDGRTTEFEAAPTLFGLRYRSAASAEQPQALLWSVRGEQAWLAEAAGDPDVGDDGRRLVSCTRLRSAGSDAAHGPGEH